MDGKIYLSVARDLEDAILAGTLREGSVVPSTHQVAAQYEINPATAARGVSQLSARGLLTKQRGIGLFVAEGARDILMEERRETFRAVKVKEILAEAQVLGISKRDLLAIIMSA